MSTEVTGRGSRRRGAVGAGPGSAPGARGTGLLDARLSPAEVRELTCRPVAVRLGRGLSLPELTVRLAACEWADGVVSLRGQWASGSGIVASRPLTVATSGPALESALAAMPEVSDHPGAEFVGGGWFGSLGYDGRSRLGFYDHVLRLDRTGVWWFEALSSPQRQRGLDRARAELTALLAVPDSPVAADPAGPGWWVGGFGGARMLGHLAAVEDAVGLIRAGELFEVNVCTRLSAPFAGDPVRLFATAVATIEPAYGAYVDGGDWALAVFSPELFLSRCDRNVRTSPIKGTWRVSDPDGASALRESAKDVAENVMIVDLMRNDFGRVCEVGSVEVDRLLEVQRHPGVWHLVSTVTGRLRPGVDDAELIQACFPPGSVTGAPKLRAIAAIGELEPVGRGAYTGAVGFVSPCSGAEWAVMIRGFEITRDRIELGVGGGITADSVPMVEWHECLTKAAPLLAAIDGQLDPDEAMDPAAEPTEHQLSGGVLETIACRDGVPTRVGDHLARLDRSSRELYRRALPPGVGDAVRAAATAAGRQPAALRLRLGPTGEVTITIDAVAATPRAASAVVTVAGRSGLWRHKWADRTALDSYSRRLAEDVAPLFIAADGTVLETARGNVFLLLPNGSLVTAPLRDDLLPGVTRRAVLDLARDEQRTVEIRSFAVAELLNHSAFTTSSLGGAVPIASVDGTPLPRQDHDVARIAQYLHPTSR